MVYSQDQEGQRTPNGGFTNRLQRRNIRNCNHAKASTSASDASISAVANIGCALRLC